MDKDTERRHYLNHPFSARYVRLHPLTWRHGIGMRAALLGCPQKTDGECGPGFFHVNAISGCSEYFFPLSSTVSQHQQLAVDVLTLQTGSSVRLIDDDGDLFGAVILSILSSVSSLNALILEVVNINIFIFFFLPAMVVSQSKTWPITTIRGSMTSAICGKIGSTEGRRWPSTATRMRRSIAALSSTTTLSIIPSGWSILARRTISTGSSSSHGKAKVKVSCRHISSR